MKNNNIEKVEELLAYMYENEFYSESVKALIDYVNTRIKYKASVSDLKRELNIIFNFCVKEHRRYGEKGDAYGAASFLSSASACSILLDVLEGKEEAAVNHERQMEGRA